MDSRPFGSGHVRGWHTVHWDSDFERPRVELTVDLSGRNLASPLDKATAVRAVIEILLEYEPSIGSEE